MHFIGSRFRLEFRGVCYSYRPTELLALTLRSCAALRWGRFIPLAPCDHRRTSLAGRSRWVLLRPRNAELVL